MLILKAFGQNILTDALSKIFGKILRTIFLAIDSIIYSLIGYLYRIFTFLSQIRLFENPRMQDLADRVYIIVGVVALFLVAYALISAIINPDNAAKGKNSSFSGIVKNLIFAIIGIAIVPSVFDYAYEFQNRILCSNVINKFFAVPTGTEDEGTNFSNEMALKLFQSFYYVKQTDGSSENNKTLYGDVTSDDGAMTLTEAFDYINKGDKSIFEALGEFDDAFDNGQLGYLYLISTVAGLYCAYVLLGFVIDIAIRSVKLSYLQLVAPLPIMTLVIPNQKKVFDNWLKKTTSCFLEVFVRVIAIAFAAYAVRYLPEYVFSKKMPTCDGGISGIILLLAKAAFIIGIFGFLKQAPKLIGELFPGFDSKGFKLGFKDSFAEVGGFRALGATGGAITSGFRNIRASGTNIKNAWNKPLGKTGNLGRGFRTAGAVFGAAVSGVAGAASGGVRAFSNGKDAKKWSDSVKFAGEGADAAMEARLKRQDYKESHGGTTTGAISGHIQDAWDKVKDYPNSHTANFNFESKRHQSADEIIKAEDAINSKIKSLLESKKDYLTGKDGRTLKVIRKAQEDAALSYEAAETAYAQAMVHGDKDEIKRAKMAKDAALQKRDIALKNVEDAEKYIKKEIRLGTKDSEIGAVESGQVVQLYEKYQTAVKNNYNSLSNDQEAFEHAKTVIQAVEQGQDFRTYIEKNPRTYLDANGNKVEVKFIDDVKIADAKTLAKMNQENEAIKKQQESKK